MENESQRKPTVCVHRHKPAYAGHTPVYRGTSLCTQLGFSRHKKGKFFELKTKVWNESHIVWELFQTLIFRLYKVLHDIFSRHGKS